jgi:hypothetical protein
MAVVLLPPLGAGVLAASDAANATEVNRVLEIDQNGDAIEAEDQTTALAARVGGYRGRAPGAPGHGRISS